MQRRQILIDHIGQLAKHVGNYGFSAAPAMAAVFIKHGINQISNSEIIKTINKQAMNFPAAEPAGYQEE